MNAKLSKCGPQNRWLAPVVFAFVAGCFSSPTPKLDRLICTTDQQCPVGYTCKVKGQPGGCCKDGDLSCGGGGSDAGKADLSFVDLRGITDTQADNGNSDGNLPADGARDQAIGGTGGSGDGAASGGTGGSADASLGSAAGGSGGGTASDGAAGSGGGTASGGGGGGAGGNGASGGGSGGSGGARLDAAPDVPPDVPAVDAPGTCGADQDCPSQSPLCLGYRCARCTADSDCAGRSGTPACLASSGLCVGCTANSHCTASVTTCDTAAHQCVGCVKRSDCPGVCQTCTNSVCTAAKSQDDTLCAGTCDSAGACKSKQGQTCQTVAAGCAAGTFCSPDGYCCDKACMGSCEACDVTIGTCTTLTSGTPHKNHTACTTSSTTVCDGKCTGASNACSYPTATTVCGSESCSTAGYQGTGTCGGGSCAMPDVVTCPNACVAGKGCTGSCKPSQVQCKTTGISQKCNANGAWDDTTCATGNTCSNGVCACSSPNTQCPSGCVNVLGSDANNCGSCGHVCGSGGTCSAGLCQAVVIVANPGPMPAILGVDDYNVYYYVHPGSDPSSELAYQVGKGATAAAGSSVDSVGAIAYSGVIGSELFSANRGYYYMCPFSSASPSQCGGSRVSVPGTGSFVGLLAAFKSTSQPTYATVNIYDSTSPSITWWSATTNNQVAMFTDGIYSGPYGYQSPFFLGDAVYWIRILYDNTYTVLEAMLYKSSAANPTLSALSANMLVDTYSVIDVNTKSVLLSGPTAKGLYRVALPGNAAAIPPLFADTGSYTVTGATEDADGVVYWMQSNGTLFSCAGSSSCVNKKSLVVGQSPSGDLFQDTNSLYWCNSNAVVRLAK